MEIQNILETRFIQYKSQIISILESSESIFIREWKTKWEHGSLCPPEYNFSTFFGIDINNFLNGEKRTYSLADERDFRLLEPAINHLKIALTHFDQCKYVDSLEHLFKVEASIATHCVKKIILDDYKMSIAKSNSKQSKKDASNLKLEASRYYRGNDFEEIRSKHAKAGRRLAELIPLKESTLTNYAKEFSKDIYMVDALIEQALQISASTEHSSSGLSLEQIRDMFGSAIQDARNGLPPR
jgi:hypothetical protein